MKNKKGDKIKTNPPNKNPYKTRFKSIRREGMKSRSKFFLIYSIALFSVAFILIGFSAFTGVRYQYEKTEAKKLYQGAQASVIELQDSLERLNKENGQLQERINVLEDQVSELGKNAAAATALEMLVKVRNLVSSGNETEAKTVFEAIDSALLPDEALILYEKLKALLY
ncbi:MAG TPA: hypothetical protein GX706_05075 [Candidatus Moranbacteria bacterium]|nr:hypothetical protein [Candidatus Moranbacteria bacterium]